MNASDNWLPQLILLGDYDGNWGKYINAVFAIFYRDFIETQPTFREKWVRCRRDPIFDGKEAGFWHCVSEGPNEDERTPDLRRCERVAWIRALIEHDEDMRVDVWTSRKKRELRPHLWFDESYLVVLGKRKKNYQLITAYCTDRGHTKRRLRRERDSARND
jgi:hypothetical protein